MDPYLGDSGSHQFQFRQAGSSWQCPGSLVMDQGVLGVAGSGNTIRNSAAWAVRHGSKPGLRWMGLQAGGLTPEA